MVFYFIASIHLKKILAIHLVYKTLPIIENKMQTIKSLPISQTHTYYVFFSRKRFKGYDLLKTIILLYFI